MSAEDSLDGVIVVDKESGLTSHDVVDRLRRIFGLRKVGHAGTLDPLATGVLVVCVGRATRIVRFLPTERKEYVAGIRLGIATDTFDAEGSPVGPVRNVRADHETVLRVCGALEGEIDQVPPMFSAVKVGGERLYKAARRGEVVNRSPRQVTIFQLDVEDYSAPYLSIRVICSPGTYIRSVAHEIGQRLGCGGHVISLRRVRDGKFALRDAREIDEIACRMRKGQIGKVILGVSEALDCLPLVRLTADQGHRFRDGQVITGVAPEAKSSVPGEVTVRVERPDGDFCGVGSLDAKGQLRPVRVFR